MVGRTKLGYSAQINKALKEYRSFFRESCTAYLDDDQDASESVNEKKFQVVSALRAISRELGGQEYLSAEGQMASLKELNEIFEHIKKLKSEDKKDKGEILKIQNNLKEFKTKVLAEISQKIGAYYSSASKEKEEKIRVFEVLLDRVVGNLETAITELNKELSEPPKPPELPARSSAVDSSEKKMSEEEKRIASLEQKITELRARKEFYKKRGDDYKKGKKKLQDQLDELEKQIDSNNEELTEAKTTIDELLAEIEKYKKQQEDLQVENATLKSQLLAKEAEIVKLELKLSEETEFHAAEADFLRKQITTLSLEKKAIGDKAAENMAKLERLKQYIGENGEKLEEFLTEVSNKDQEIASLRQLKDNLQINIRHLESEIGQLKALISQHLSSIDKQKQQIAELTRKLAESEEKNSDKDQTISALQAQILELQRQLSAKHSSDSADLAALREDLARATVEATKLRSSLGRATAEVGTDKSTIEAQQHEIARLQQLLEEQRKLHEDQQRKIEEALAANQELLARLQESERARLAAEAALAAEKRKSATAEASTEKKEEELTALRSENEALQARLAAAEAALRARDAEKPATVETASAAAQTDPEDFIPAEEHKQKLAEEIAALQQAHASEIEKLRAEFIPKEKHDQIVAALQEEHARAIAELQAKLAGLEAQLEASRAIIEDLKRQLQEAQAAAVAARAEADKAKADAAAAKEAADAAKAEAAAAGKKADGAEEAVATADKRAAEAEAKAEAAGKRQEEVEDRLYPLTEEQKKQIKALQEENEKLKQELAALKAAKANTAEVAVGTDPPPAKVTAEAGTENPESDLALGLTGKKPPPPEKPGEDGGVLAKFSSLYNKEIVTLLDGTPVFIREHLNEAFKHTNMEHLFKEGYLITDPPNPRPPTKIQVSDQKSPTGVGLYKEAEELLQAINEKKLKPEDVHEILSKLTPNKLPNGIDGNFISAVEKGPPEVVEFLVKLQREKISNPIEFALADTLRRASRSNDNDHLKVTVDFSSERLLKILANFHEDLKMELSKKPEDRNIEKMRSIQLTLKNEEAAYNTPEIKALIAKHNEFTTALIAKLKTGKNSDVSNLDLAAENSAQEALLKEIQRLSGFKAAKPAGPAVGGEPPVVHHGSGGGLGLP